MPEPTQKGVSGFTQDGMSPEGSKEQANKGSGGDRSIKEEDKEE